MYDLCALPEIINHDTQHLVEEVHTAIRVQETGRADRVTQVENLRQLKFTLHQYCTSTPARRHSF